MLPTKKEVETNILHGKRKMREIARKGENISNSELFDLCTLNLIVDAAEKERKEDE